MIRTFAFLFLVSVAASAHGQTVYRDPGGRFTLQIPSSCRNFSPNGDLLSITCGDASLNLLQAGPSGPAVALLQNIEQQYAGQWRDFRKIGGGTSSDQRLAYAAYAGSNPNGVSSALKITAFANGFVVMESAPQAATGSQRLLDQIFATVQFAGGAAAATFVPEPTPAPVRARTTNVSPVSPRVTPASTTTGSLPRFAHFKKVSVMDDPRYLGGEVLSLLAPADWRTQSSIEWHSGNLYYAAARLRITSPDGISEIGEMPSLNFEWNPAIVQYQGETTTYPEVQPPVMGHSALLRNLIIPRYFPELRSARVVSDEELPQPAAEYCEGFAKIHTQFRYNCTAGKVRLEYAQGGTTVQEDIYAVAWYLSGAFNAVNWGVLDIRYSKAPTGKLEDQYRTFQTIFSSARVSLPWYNAYTQLNSQAMRASNDRMRMARETMNHISNNMRESYENRVASEERIMDKWDNVIRGVDAYDDGSGSTVELPNSYDHTWTNGNGDYVQSNDANFNPNSVSSGSWRQIHPKH